MLHPVPVRFGIRVDSEERMNARSARGIDRLDRQRQLDQDPQPDLRFDRIALQDGIAPGSHRFLAALRFVPGPGVVIPLAINWLHQEPDVFLAKGVLVKVFWA
jgi:hypothetical protein